MTWVTWSAFGSRLAARYCMEARLMDIKRMPRRLDEALDDADNDADVDETEIPVL